LEVLVPRLHPLVVIAALALPGPALARPAAVMIDAGHGTADNRGMRTVDGRFEADVTLELARDLSARLRAGGLRVLEARTSSVGPSYPARAARAQKQRVAALIGLHVDARGEAWWTPCPPGTPDVPDAPAGHCLRASGHDGVAVLVADRGPRRVVAARLALARALARAVAEAGLPLYDGADYAGLFEPDETPGVFLDRRGLYMLRRPRVPSVIVETHQGLDPEARRRWSAPETRARLARAVAAALAPTPRPAPSSAVSVGGPAGSR
jgi:N-acetylmuramoyl-L-alanine amidase